jgi:hypothetical protein
MGKRRSNKPYIQLTVGEKPQSYFNDNSPQRINHRDYVDFPTYRKLLSELRKCSRVCTETWEVYVFRSRRGEWGEWFEKWSASNGKLTKIKYGWM